MRGLMAQKLRAQTSKADDLCYTPESCPHQLPLKELCDLEIIT